MAGIYEDDAAQVQSIGGESSCTFPAQWEQSRRSGRKHEDQLARRSKTVRQCGAAGHDDTDPGLKTWAVRLSGIRKAVEYICATEAPHIKQETQCT